MEREFKWMIPDPSEFDPIADSSTVSALVQKKGRLEMEAMYYDTADNLIARCHGGLRLRRENETCVVCLKLAAESGFGGALKAREEYECTAPDIRTGIQNLPAAGAPQDICDCLLQANLIELGRTAFTRFWFLLSYQGCTCELAFDYGKLTRNGRVGPICEMELELKSGSEADFDALAVQLQQEFDLKPQPLSKLARMMRL
ncbi:CYTH domain-containing protein [Butyricicoccus sp.]|uniref:CYTH domain-containing protein n=1 Tax=Butyricicoccus sp. TaxID=2049021 RepID=UPI003F14834A